MDLLIALVCLGRVLYPVVALLAAAHRLDTDPEAAERLRKAVEKTLRRQSEERSRQQPGPAPTKPVPKRAATTAVTPAKNVETAPDEAGNRKTYARPRSTPACPAGAVLDATTFYETYLSEIGPSR